MGATKGGTKTDFVGGDNVRRNKLLRFKLGRTTTESAREETDKVAGSPWSAWNLFFGGSFLCFFGRGKYDKHCFSS